MLVKDISNLFSHRVDSRSSNARDRSLVKRRLSWYIAECSSIFYDLVLPFSIRVQIILPILSIVVNYLFDLSDKDKYGFLPV